MITDNRCNLCESEEFELIRSTLRDGSSEYKVNKCLGCGHVQLLPKPDEKEDKEFYDKNRQDRDRGKEIDYAKLSSNNLFDTERHVRLVQELCPDKEAPILDIGAGYGFFVNGLYDAGYRNSIGVEISEERRNLAIENGRAEVIDLDINNPGRDIGRFNLITLFHVLEHMNDPVQFLKNIKSFMEPGGIFVCEVPNVNELLITECPSYNDFYWIRAHLNYFSKDTLSNCLNQAGFSNIEIRFEQRYGLLNLCNWLSTGKPQIDRPVFDIGDAYKPMEAIYRKYIEEKEASDAMIALARI